MLYLVWKHWCLQMLDMTRASLKASILRCLPLACNKCRFLWNSFRPCSRHANLIEQHKKRSPFTFSHPSTTDPNIFQHLQLPALLGSFSWALYGHGSFHWHIFQRSVPWRRRLAGVNPWLVVFGSPWNGHMIIYMMTVDDGFIFISPSTRAVSK